MGTIALAANTLHCVNCGAKYKDRWSQDQSPVCPHCRCSHYEQADGPPGPPTRNQYLCYLQPVPPSTEPLSEYWTRYQKVNDVADSDVQMLDDYVVGRVALQYARRTLTLSRQRLYSDMRGQTWRRSKQLWPDLDEEQIPFLVDTLSGDRDTEDEALTLIELEKLNEAWRQTGKDAIDLQQAFDLPCPRSTTSAADRKQYKRVRARLSRFRAWLLSIKSPPPAV